MKQEISNYIHDAWASGYGPPTIPADYILVALANIPKHHGNPAVPPGYLSFQATYLLVLLHKLGVRPQ